MFESLIDCMRRLNNTLFVAGEIGGNDYTYALLLGGKDLEEAKALVRDIVQATKEAVRVSVFFFLIYYLLINY